MATRIADATRNAIANTVAGLVDAGAAAGTLKVYSGTQPATADTAASGTLLVTFTLTDPAFAAAVAGVADLDADPDLEATADATGTAGWFRIADSNGATVVDGSVGTSSAELTISSVDITTGAVVRITTGTLTAPEA